MLTKAERDAIRARWARGESYAGNTGALLDTVGLTANRQPCYTW